MVEAAVDSVLERLWWHWSKAPGSDLGNISDLRSWSARDPSERSRSWRSYLFVHRLPSDCNGHCAPSCEPPERQISLLECHRRPRRGSNAGPPIEVGCPAERFRVRVDIGFCWLSASLFARTVPTSLPERRPAVRTRSEVSAGRWAAPGHGPAKASGSKVPPDERLADRENRGDGSCRRTVLLTTLAHRIALRRQTIPSSKGLPPGRRRHQTLRGRRREP